MERKLIKLANKTLVVSLPYEWVKKQELKKGNSVEVIDKDNELLIRPKKSIKEKEKIIVIKDYTPRLIKRTISAYYKLGFDKLKVIGNKEQLADLEKLINSYVGLIIIEKQGDGLTIKNIINQENSDFDAIFKKTFLILCSLASESLMLIKNEDEDGLLELVKDKENFVKHTTFCVQILNMGGIKNIKETNIYFYMLSIFDVIGDIYFRICQNFINYKDGNKIDFGFYAKVNNFIDKTYKAFFSDYDTKQVYMLREDLFDKKLQRNSYTTLLAVIIKMILELIECKIMLNLLNED